MDPDANLEEQLRIVERINEERDKESDEFTEDITEDAYRLAELVETQDGWIKSGGFLPKRWRR
jgi:hypothetical protein